jgi:hypothetical protein
MRLPARTRPLLAVCLGCRAGLILVPTGRRKPIRGLSLNQRPVGDQMGQSLTTVCSTISASPSTRAVTGRLPGTIREDLRARVAVQFE